LELKIGEKALDKIQEYIMLKNGLKSMLILIYTFLKKVKYDIRFQILSLARIPIPPRVLMEFIIVSNAPVVKIFYITPAPKYRKQLYGERKLKHYLMGTFKNPHSVFFLNSLYNAI
jgi:hypothetical protein